MSPARPSPGIVVYERSGHWAAGLRTLCERKFRSPSGLGLPIHEVRTLTEAGDALQAGIGQTFVLELTSANAPRLLEFLGRVDDHHPDVKNIIVCRPRDGAWEHPARVAGAIHFARSLAGLNPVLEWLERQNARTDVDPAGSILDRIAASLPWPSSTHHRSTRNTDV